MYYINVFFICLISALMKQLEEKKKRSKTDHNKLVNQLASTRQDLSRCILFFNFKHLM